MGSRRGLIAGLALAAACGAAWLAPPRRFEVEGVSMGPGLLPGDVVRTGPFPLLDRLRPPRRFECWLLAAADGLAVKRIVGLPGEAVAIADGDLVVAGEPILKGPRLLAEVGSVVPDDPAAAPPVEPGWSWSRPGGEVLDDAAFDEGATRVLGPVRDVGLVALVDVQRASAADPAEIRVRVAGTVVARPLAAAGRHAVVAGRLDGRLVVATWRVAGDTGLGAARACQPAGAPRAWLVSMPWPEPADDAAAPALAIGGGERVAIAEVGRWRDVAWRPGVDGRASWTLGAAEVLVLGDHPAASTDSRRWGPVETEALRYRVVAAQRPVTP